MQERSYLSYNPLGFHRVFFTDWGKDTSNRLLMCVHGLTRNSRDFDYLAKGIETHFRVICPDLVGRGKSDWLTNPNLYAVPQYINDLITLLAKVETKEMNYLGTSLGGILGIILAGSSKSPIKKLILNDVGPKIPSIALLPIIKYTKANLSFSSIEEFESYLRRLYAALGPLTDEQWGHLVQYSHYKSTDGRYHYACDPGVIVPIMLAFPRAHLWNYWKAIKCPILVIHGKKSRVLTSALLEKMHSIQPNMEIIEVPDAGHAPALMDNHSINLIHNWLVKGEV